MSKLAETALILAAHGSKEVTTAAAATERLADVIRARHIFAEVACCFWKEKPFLADFLSLVSARQVAVLPNFAGEGHFTQEILPREMGLSGAVTEREGRKIFYCPPLGSHPGLATLVERRIEHVLHERELFREDCALIIVGHGSRKPGGASGTAKLLAKHFQDAGFVRTQAMFLEEEPFASQWREMAGRHHPVVILPFLIGEGAHERRDIPQIFDLPMDEWTGHEKDVVEGEENNRPLICLRGLGTPRDLADLAVDLVQGRLG
jgi:sirohydrochlorin cobaltochelatase